MSDLMWLTRLALVRLTAHLELRMLDWAKGIGPAVVRVCLKLPKGWESRMQLR